MATGEFDIRHRLVGAAALVLAGVFLIPWLLNTLGGAPEQRPARVKAVAPSPEEFRSRIIPKGDPKGDPDGPPSAVNGTGVRVTPVPRVTIPSEPLVPAPAEQPEQTEQPEPETPAATAAVPVPAPQRDSEPPEKPEDRQAGTSATPPAQPSARPTAAAAGGGARDSVPAAGWVVRVGTFTDGVNAERLVARLRDGGFSPSSSPVQIQGREATRVWLGPFEDRAEAIRVRSRVFDSVGEKGFIIRQE